MSWVSKSSCGVSAAHHLTQSMAGAPTDSQPSWSQATVLLPGRALLPNREQCRTRQEVHSTFPGTEPSRTVHPKSCPFPWGSTPLCLLPLWQQHSGAAALQAGGCPAQRRHTQGCEVAPPAKQRALQISPVLNTYLRPSHSEHPTSCISSPVKAHCTPQPARFKTSMLLRNHQGGDQRHRAKPQGRWGMPRRACIAQCRGRGEQ